MDLLAPSVELTDDGVEVRSPEIVEDTSRVELLPLQGFLGVEEPGARQRTQLKEIWDYFGEDSQGTGDALYKIKMTEMKMTAPKLGESRLSKLASYVKLHIQMKDLEKHLEVL